MCVFVCVRARVCVWRRGRTILKRETSRAPVVTLGATKSRPAFSPNGLSACPSGACLDHSWAPRLGQNLWGIGAYVASRLGVCVRVCDPLSGCTVFTRSSRLDPYGHTGVLGSGRFPIIAGLRCRCVSPTIITTS